jgi:ferric-dicitrate binding protein FerR (iron transport regulator)
MKKQQIEKLVNKYLDGKCTPDEEVMLGEYLEFLSNKKSKLDKKELSYEELAGDETYARILQTIGNLKEEKRGLTRVVASGSLLKIAASIIVILALSVYLLHTGGVFRSNSNQITWTERKTISGEKSILNFPDGVKITLNGNSKLKYTQNLQNHKREVFLDGEAFFEVKHDTSRQFIVHSKNITTTDLGTQFNISAFTDDKNISVSLVEGSVKVTETKPNSVQKASILQPNEKLVYNSGSKLSKIEKFDLLDAIGWKDNILKFKDETLKNVFVKLERAYGIKFELQTKSFESFLITANFDKASVETVTKLIKKLTGLEYRNIKENAQIKEVIFYKK